MIQPRVRVRGIMTTYNCPSAALLSSSDRDVSSDSQAKWKAEMGSQSPTTFKTQHSHSHNENIKLIFHGFMNFSIKFIEFHENKYSRLADPHTPR